MKRIFFVTVIIEAQEMYNGVKPDIEQVSALLKEKVQEGCIEEKLFRRNICMNIMNRKIDVVQLM